MSLKKKRAPKEQKAKSLEGFVKKGKIFLRTKIFII